MKSYKMFIQWAHQTVGMLFTVAVFMTAVAVFLNAPSFADALEYFIMLLPLYILIMGIFVLPMLAANVYQVYIPAGISLGCSRKKTFAGGCVMRVICCMEVVLAVLILESVTGWENFEGYPGRGLEFLAAMFFLYLAFMAVGDMLGIIYLRYGKIGIIIMILFFMVCGGGVGGVLGLSLTAKDISEMLETILQSGMVLKMGFVAAVVINVVSGLFVYRQLSKLEIKF